VCRCVGNQGIGRIRPQVDVDACIDEKPDRIQVPCTRHNVQRRKSLLLDEGVETVVEHRRQDAGISRVRGFEPDARVETIVLLCRPLNAARSSGSGLAGCKADKNERRARKPAA
jgi:hypothetical protein